MNFIEACIDVLENNEKYKRTHNVGIRNKYNGIEFYHIKDDSTATTRGVMFPDLTSDWTKIEDDKYWNLMFSGHISSDSFKSIIKCRDLILKDLEEFIFDWNHNCAKYTIEDLNSIIHKRFGELK